MLRKALLREGQWALQAEQRTGLLESGDELGGVFHTMQRFDPLWGSRAWRGRALNRRATGSTLRCMRAPGSHGQKIDALRPRVQGYNVYFLPPFPMIRLEAVALWCWTWTARIMCTALTCGC